MKVFAILLAIVAVAVNAFPMPGGYGRPSGGYGPPSGGYGAPGGYQNQGGFDGGAQFGDQGGFNQGGFNQGGFNQGGFNQGAGFQGQFDQQGR
ncbi:unnamed protein product [Caenorhabditis nigoni]